MYTAERNTSLLTNTISAVDNINRSLNIYLIIIISKLITAWGKLTKQAALISILQF